MDVIKEIKYSVTLAHEHNSLHDSGRRLNWTRTQSNLLVRFNFDIDGVIWLAYSIHLAARIGERRKVVNQSGSVVERFIETVKETEFFRIVGGDVNKLEQPSWKSDEGS